MVERDEAREVCDWLAPEVEGACITEIEPTVDSHLLTKSLLKAARAKGAQVTIAEVDGLSDDGVTLADGSQINADAIVLAMGPWTNEAGNWMGYEIPVVPQKGELLYMHWPADEAGGIDQDRPSATMHNMDEGGVILTRRLSRTVLGATKEDGKRLRPGAVAIRLGVHSPQSATTDQSDHRRIRHSSHGMFATNAS